MRLHWVAHKSPSWSSFSSFDLTEDFCQLLLKVYSREAKVVSNVGRQIEYIGKSNQASSRPSILAALCDLRLRLKDGKREEINRFVLKMKEKNCLQRCQDVWCALEREYILSLSLFNINSKIDSLIALLIIDINKKRRKSEWQRMLLLMHLHFQFSMGLISAKQNRTGSISRKKTKWVEMRKCYISVSFNWSYLWKEEGEKCTNENIVRYILHWIGVRKWKWMRNCLQSFFVYYCYYYSFIQRRINPLLSTVNFFW